MIKSLLSKPRDRRRRVAVALLGALLFQVIVAAPGVKAATITDVSWAISKAHPGDTAVRYTWTFTPQTTATLSKVTFTVPSGTAGASLTVADVYGLPSGGSASLSGTTVTYSFTATSVSAGVKAMVAIDGFTNTTTAGSYTSTVTSFDNQVTPAQVDTGTSQSVTIDANTTGVTVVIARSASFDNDTDSFRMLMDPSHSSHTDLTKDVNLTVKTNAGGGYSLAFKASSLSTGTYTLQPVTAGVATGVATASFTTNRWGFTVGTIGGDAVGTKQGALATAGNYVGYTTAGETIVSSTGSTNSDTIPVTNRVKIDYKQPAGTYSSTITYTLTPTY